MLPEKHALPVPTERLKRNHFSGTVCHQYGWAYHRTSKVWVNGCRAGVDEALQVAAGRRISVLHDRKLALMRKIRSPYPAATHAQAAAMRRELSRCFAGADLNRLGKNSHVPATGRRTQGSTGPISMPFCEDFQFGMKALFLIGLCMHPGSGAASARSRRQRALETMRAYRSTQSRDSAPLTQSLTEL